MTEAIKTETPVTAAAVIAATTAKPAVKKAATKKAASALAGEFKDVKSLDTAIEKVIKSSQSLQADIQKVAIGIVAHAYKHGDYTRANLLVVGLGDGVRKVALVEWFNKCGLVVEDGASEFTGFNKKYAEKHFDEMKSTNWWTLKPQRPFSGFDLMAEIARVIKKADKMASDATLTDEEKAQVVIDADTLTALRNMTIKAGI